jgi:hypothetical protein
MPTSYHHTALSPVAIRAAKLRAAAAKAAARLRAAGARASRYYGRPIYRGPRFVNFYSPANRR